jgi:DNA-binding response OmpR family regulator
LAEKEVMMRTWSTILRRRPRPQSTTQEQVIQADGVVLDVPRRRAQVDGYLVHLPAREASVLGVLLAHAGQVVHRAALADAAGDIDQTHRDLDRLMHRLRRRIEPSPLTPARLHRVGDTGYLFGSTARAGSC